MTEEEKTEREACFAAIRETVQRLSRLMDTAYQQYSQLVEQVVKDRITGSRRSSGSWTALWTSGMTRDSLLCTRPFAAMSMTNILLL